MQIIFISIYKEKRYMTLHGKFIINDADYSPLEFDGVGVFMAFSGNGAYRNKEHVASFLTLDPLPKVNII